MNKLEEIRKSSLIKHMRILLPSIDFLLRAVEQLMNGMARIQERAERVNEGEDWDMGEYCIRIIDALDTDIRELLEK